MNRITPRAVHFRTRPETEKRDERTKLGKVASAVGGGLVLAGAGKLWHSQ